MRRTLCCVIGLLAGAALSIAQDSPLKSGPQPGTVLPGPFDAFVIKGKIAEGRQHCPICQNGLNPGVLVFAREPAADAKDEPLTSLLAQLDKTLETHEEAPLGGYVVFLSPDARSSVTESASEEIEKLLEEKKKRDALHARLKSRAESLKYVVVTAFPEEGPKGYKVDPKADVTVVLYNKLKVLDNWSFAKEKLTEKDADALVKKVDERLLELRKKKKAS